MSSNACPNIFILNNDISCKIKRVKTSKISNNYSFVYVDKELFIQKQPLIYEENIFDQLTSHYFKGNLNPCDLNNSIDISKEGCKGSLDIADYSEIEINKFSQYKDLSTNFAPSRKNFKVKKSLTNRPRSCSDYFHRRLTNYENYQFLNAMESLETSPIHRRHSCPTHFGFQQLTLKTVKTLKCGDIMIHCRSKDDSLLTKINSSLITGNCWSLFYDKDGDVILTDSGKIDKINEDDDDVWLYPQTLTPHQATIMLSLVNLTGCFLLYQCQNTECGTRPDHMISLVNNRHEALHYKIKQAINGDFAVENDTKSFQTLSELVKYFSENRRHLARRLRKSLQMLSRPSEFSKLATSKYNIKRDQLNISKTLLVHEGRFEQYIGTMDGCPDQKKIKLRVLIEQLPEALDDFVYELSLLKLLNHFNIVSFVGVNLKERPYCSITEYPMYGSLRLCLQDGVIPSSSQQALSNVTVQILKSLQYLETKRFIVHRNLSTSSFFVSERHVIKLGEFERARSISFDEFVAEDDEDVLIRYAAPEVLAKLLYSTKSDIWAFGITLWEVFNKGEVPYHSVRAKNLILAVISGHPPLPFEGCTSLTKDIILKCLNRNFKYRPSASQLLKILEQQILQEAITNEKLKASRNVRQRTQSFSGFTSFKQGKEMLNKFLGKNIFGGSASTFCTPTMARKRAVTLQGLKFRQLTNNSTEALLRGNNDRLQLDNSKFSSKPPSGVAREKRT